MTNFELPGKKNIEDAYNQYAGVRLLISKDIEQRLEETLAVLSPHPTVKSRIKDVGSYYKKYINILKQNSDVAKAFNMPIEIPVITDIIGIRIVCPFIANLSEVQILIKNSFNILDAEKKGSNYSYKEFGYESIHLLIKIPEDIDKSRGYSGCDVAEIQIRTILQDAWAEVEHELVYKAEFTPFDESMKRKLAAINASLSLADTIFQEIRNYQQQLHRESDKRREDFFNKLEENTDAFLFNKDEPEPKTDAVTQRPDAGTIDDLLLNALYAHNRKDFKEAIRLYTKILEMKPKNNIVSIIYNHRGMANFAQSLYEDAIADFDNALKFDEKAYKAVYYRGLINLVLCHYAEAIEDFTLSLRINPYQAYCLYRRGHAYYHSGDFFQALSNCEAALVLMPEYEDAQKFKELVLRKISI